MILGHDISWRFSEITKQGARVKRGVYISNFIIPHRHVGSGYYKLSPLAAVSFSLFLLVVALTYWKILTILIHTVVTVTAVTYDIPTSDELRGCSYEDRLIGCGLATLTTKNPKYMHCYEDIDIKLSSVQIDICVLNYYEDIDTKLSSPK